MTKHLFRLRLAGEIAFLTVLGSHFCFWATYVPGVLTFPVGFLAGIPLLAFLRRGEKLQWS